MNKLNGLKNGMNNGLNNDKRGNRSIFNNITSMFSKTKIKFTRRSYHAFITCSFIFILSLSFLFINDKFNLGIFAQVQTGTVDGITDGEITYTYDEQKDVLTLNGYGTLQERYDGLIWYNTTLGFGRDVKAIHIVGDSETNMIKLPTSCYSLFDTANIGGYDYLDDLREITFTNVDVSNVTDTSYMFYCLNLDYLDISKDSMKSDFENLDNMKYMFFGSTIECLDMSGCDISSVTQTDNTFTDTYIERIILPCAVSDSYDIELFVDSDHYDDYAWFGFDKNGTIVYNHDYSAEYDTLPQKDGALEEIRLISYDYDMYYNELYYSGDLQYFWDLSENGDMSQIVAYYKDYDDPTKYDGGELVIFDTTQNDETDYLMGFDGYFYKDSSGSVTNSNGEDMTNFLSCDFTSNLGDCVTYDDSSYTPWSYMNATTDDKVHKVTIANKINTFSFTNYFAGLDELSEVNLCEMTYNASLENNDHCAYKMFERDDNFTIKFRGRAALMGYMLEGAGSNVIVDMRGSDLYYANVRSYISNTYFPAEKVYIPDHMTAAKTNFSFYFPSRFTSYVAYYNDEDELCGYYFNILARDETEDLLGKEATYFVGAPKIPLINEYNKFAEGYNIGDSSEERINFLYPSSYEEVDYLIRYGILKDYIKDDDMLSNLVKNGDQDSIFSCDDYANTAYHNEFALAYVFEKRFNDGKDKLVNLSDDRDILSFYDDIYEYFDKLMHPVMEAVNARSSKTTDGVKEYFYNYKDNINIKVTNPLNISDPGFNNKFYLYEDKWNISNAYYNSGSYEEGIPTANYRRSRYNAPPGIGTCDEKWEDDDYYYFKYILTKNDDSLSVKAHAKTDTPNPFGDYSYLNDVEYEFEILEDIGIGETDKVCEATIEYDKDYLIFYIYKWMFDENGKYTFKYPFYHYDSSDDQQDLRLSNPYIQKGKYSVTIKVPKK